MVNRNVNENIKVYLDDDLVNISLHRDTGIVNLTWKASCGNLLDEEHSKEMEEIKRRMEKMKPKKLLVNLQNCQYFLSPKKYAWYNFTLFSLFGRSQPQALAFVAPSNLFNQLAFEANLESTKKHRTKVQYFRDHEKAEKWLERE
ncbi:MAG: hypothetical protein JW731_10150 [Bacteroidales bacterium]|nr:hypothetical protein [Bacteroidales bacterium]